MREKNRGIRIQVAANEKFVHFERNIYTRSLPNLYSFDAKSSQAA